MKHKLFTMTAAAILGVVAQGASAATLPSAVTSLPVLGGVLASVTSALPALPVAIPGVGSLPSLPSLPNVGSVPSVPSVPGLPGLPSTGSLPALPGLGSLPALPAQNGVIGVMVGQTLLPAPISNVIAAGVKLNGLAPPTVVVTGLPVAIPALPALPGLPL